MEKEEKLVRHALIAIHQMGPQFSQDILRNLVVNDYYFISPLH